MSERTPLIQPNTCSTCLFKTREQNGTLLCRLNPPTTVAIVAPGPGGNVAVLGHTTSYPQVGAGDWCWQHPDMVKPVRKPVLMS